MKNNFLGERIDSSHYRTAGSVQVKLNNTNYDVALVDFFDDVVHAVCIEYSNGWRPEDHWNYELAKFLDPDKRYWWLTSDSFGELILTNSVCPMEIV